MFKTYHLTRAAVVHPLPGGDPRDAVDSHGGSGHRRASRLAIVLLLSALGVVPTMAEAGSAHAAGLTFSVNGATGSDPATPGACQSTSFKTVGAALACVSSDSPPASNPDTITVAPGTYSEHLQISANVNLAGSSGKSVLDGGNSGPVVYVNSGYSLSLSGVTIQHGLGAACAPGNIDSGGGGICNLGALTVSNSTISNNVGAEFGGALFNWGTATLINTTVSNNSAKYFGGGLADASGALTLRGSTVSHNTASRSGGIDGGVTLVNSTVSYNSGAGIDAAGDPGPVVLTGSTVSNNGGDGIDTSAGGTLTNSTVSSNGRTGISMSGEFNALTLNSSVVRGNQCAGITNLNGDLGNAVTLNSSSVSRNSDVGDCGGAGGITNVGGILTLNSSTVADNVAPDDYGGGVYNAGTLTMVNSSITGNIGFAGGGIYSDDSWYGPATVSMTGSTVSRNSPDNCERDGAVVTCGT